MFVNFVWPPKLENIPPCYVFLIQVISGNCIFSHSLAKLPTIVQDRKVDKHTPPAVGGLYSLYSYLNIEKIYLFITNTKYYN